MDRNAPDFLVPSSRVLSVLTAVSLAAVLLLSHTVMPCCISALADHGNISASVLMDNGARMKVFSHFPVLLNWETRVKRLLDSEGSCP